MSEYVVIFAGELIEGQPLETVKERLAVMFKVTLDRIDHLFSGEWVTIKKGLDHDTASRYDAALQRAGALVYVMEAKEVADFIANHTVVTPPPAPAIPPPPPPPPPIVPVVVASLSLSKPTTAESSSVDEAALMAAVDAAMATVEANASPEPDSSSLLPTDELLDMNQLFGQPTSAPPPTPPTPTPTPIPTTPTLLTERGVVIKSSPTDLHELEQVEVKSEWSDTLQIHEEIAPPEVDLEGIDLGAVGELLVEPTPFIPLEIDLDHLAWDESGAPLTEPVEVAPLQIDISHIDLQERV